MAWEPDRRSNFFFSPPAHLCAVTYMTEILLIVTLNNQFTTSPVIKLESRQMQDWANWSELSTGQKKKWLGEFKAVYSRFRYYMYITDILLWLLDFDIDAVLHIFLESAFFNVL